MAPAFTAHGLNSYSETTADRTTPNVQQRYQPIFYNDEADFMIEGDEDSMTDVSSQSYRWITDMKLISNAQMYDSDDNHPPTPVNDVVSQLSAAAAADDMVKIEDASDVEHKPKIEESLFLTDRSESEDESRRRERIAARAALPPTPDTTPNTRRMPRLKFKSITNPLRTRRGIRPTRGVLPTPAATPSLSRKRVRFGTSSPDNDDENDADYSPTQGANKRACLSTYTPRPSDPEENV
ncbi:MAG: hypothetical protein Q9183_005633, partial [Haloplaca sp. 2 TL-2023]